MGSSHARIPPLQIARSVSTTTGTAHTQQNGWNTFGSHYWQKLQVLGTKNGETFPNRSFATRAPLDGDTRILSKLYITLRQSNSSTGSLGELDRAIVLATGSIAQIALRYVSPDSEDFVKDKIGFALEDTLVIHDELLNANGPTVDSLLRAAIFSLRESPKPVSYSDLAQIQFLLSNDVSPLQLDVIRRRHTHLWDPQRQPLPLLSFH